MVQLRACPMEGFPKQEGLADLHIHLVFRKWNYSNVLTGLYSREINGLLGGISNATAFEYRGCSS